MKRARVIAGVSDISLGYGSPQLVALTRLCGRRYAVPRCICSRPPVGTALQSGELSDLSLHRVPTTSALHRRRAIQYNVEWPGRSSVCARTSSS